MPGWWQAPILTGKARRENSNPGSSVAHQTLTSPQAGLHQPGLWMVHLVGFTCAITEGVFLHLDYKRSGSPQSSGLLQIRTPPPYHSSSASHLAIPSINFADDYLENKGRHRWGFGVFFVILFLIYILPTPSSLIWENTRKGDPTSSLGHAHCHAIDLA